MLTCTATCIALVLLSTSTTPSGIPAGSSMFAQGSSGSTTNGNHTSLDPTVPDTVAVGCIDAHASIVSAARPRISVNSLRDAADRACSQIAPSTWLALKRSNFSEILSLHGITKPTHFTRVFAHTRTWTWRTSIEDYIRIAVGVDWSLIGERAVTRSCKQYCRDSDSERRYWEARRAGLRNRLGPDAAASVPPLPWLKKPNEISCVPSASHSGHCQVNPMRTALTCLPAEESVHNILQLINI